MDEIRRIIAENQFNVGSKVWVNVTHINNPDNFYVRLASLLKYMKILEQSGEPIDPKNIRNYTNVIYKSQVKDKFIRGKIMYIDETNMTCEIFALDYGHIEKSIPFNDLCEDKNHGIPMLANLCELADCVPNNGVWKDDAKSTLEFFAGEEKALLTVVQKKRNVLVVELRNSCPDDLARLLAYVGISNHGFPCNSVSRFVKPVPSKMYFKHRNFEIGEKLRVRVQSGKDLGGFFVADKNDHKCYLKQLNDFKSYMIRFGDPLKIEEMKVGKHVAVYSFSNTQYERGIITKVLGEEKVQVQLVDWGSKVEANLDFLKDLPDKFYNLPVTAIYCCVDQLLPAAIARLLVGYEFFITIKKLGFGFEKPHQVVISMD